MTLVPPSGSASSQALALEFVAARRDELAEAIALAAHDVLVSDRVGFASVRDGATAAIEAVEAVLAGSYAPSAVSTLNRLALRAIDRGVPLGVLVAAVQASFGVLVAVVGEAEPRAVAAAARASSVVASEVSGTAARSLEERNRSALRRRFDRADRFRQAAGDVAATAVDVGRVLAALAAATVRTLDYDWSAVALRESDGRLTIAALEGRGAGWSQRWALRDDAGFAGRAIASRAAVSTADPDLMPYQGADRPAVIVAAPLLSAADGHASPEGILFAGRDDGPLPDEDDVNLSAGLAAVGARALDSARLHAAARRTGRQASVLTEAIALALGGSDQAALATAARSATEATGADLALIRVLDEDTGELVTRGVHARSSALAAELEGMRAPLDPLAAARLAAGEEIGGEALRGDAAAERISDRLGPVVSVALPVRVGSRVAGAVLLARSDTRSFAEAELADGRVVAAHVALLVELDRLRRRMTGGPTTAAEAFDRLGETLAPGADEARVARIVARITAEALGAQRAVVWNGDDADALVPVAGVGFRQEELAAVPGRTEAGGALTRGERVTGTVPSGVESLGGWTIVAVPLVHGGETLGVLELLHRDPPAAGTLAPLQAFAARAADVLNGTREARRRDEDLVRLRDLVAIASRAGAGASLPQTLAAVVDHTAALAVGARAGVFTVEEGRIALAEPSSAASGGTGAVVATLLRSEAGTDHVLVRDAGSDPRLRDLAGELAEARIASALLVPLRVREDTIGVLVLVADTPDLFGEREVALLRRQAPPIALAVQSALLAGQAARLESELTTAVAAERAARSELTAQIALARAVIEGWGPEASAQAVAEAALELAGSAAAAVLAVEPGQGLRPVALRVASAALDAAVRRIVRDEPVRLPLHLWDRLVCGSLVVDAGAGLVGSGLLPAPLLGPGSSVGLLPLCSGGSVTALLVVASLDPERPVEESTLTPVLRYADQAAHVLRPASVAGAP